MSHNQQPNIPGGPVSFKSNPQRHKTQKWVKAPTYDYEGDEWAGYDDGYYGYDDPPPPPQPQAQAQAQAPYQQGRPRDRTNSFDRGDEARQFSAPAAPASSSAFPVYEEPRRPSHDYGAGPRSAASGARGSHDMPRSRSRPRDFTNPEQVPPPLSMRPGAPPMPHASPTPNEWFPPRKSSMRGGTAEAAAQAAEARAIAESVTKPPVSADANNPDKPLPIIRPSDIYKRIAERRASEAEEGGRPSMDTLNSEVSPNQALGLEPVAESRESRMFMDHQVPNVDTENRQPSNNAASGQLPTLHTGAVTSASQPGRSTLTPREYRDTSPTLPQLAPVSGFGDDFARILDAGSEDTSRAITSLNTAGLSGSQTTFSSLQNTPTATRAPYGTDPAAQVAAERQHDVSVDAIANQNSAALQHQPSSGFRSAVHQAFDHEGATPLSRDNSEGHGSTGINRSDTSSTAGISPIMSRVPSAATAKFQQQQRMEETVPSIAEEPTSAHTPTASRPGPGLQGQHRISRKPSPGAHSRTASGERPSSFEPGYRRSLDPPSTGTSPARTPELETTANKRLSAPLSAVPMSDNDAPDVADQAAEMPDPHLEPAETPASEVSDVRDLGGPAAYKPLPTATRGRSDTNYSEREADLAAAVNSSSDKGVASPAIAEAQRDSQKLFLETHSGTPNPTSPRSPNARLGSPLSGTPAHGGRADSPAKSRSRVREIAHKFHQIHEHSRRNSAASIGSNKSSWSQFSTDAPRLKRQGTSQSALAVENPVADHDAREPVGFAAPQPHRPEFGREESFRPDLPGGWISTAPTPSVETPPPNSDARAMHETSPLTPTMPQGLERATSDDNIDLTPTTKKHQLRELPNMPSSEAVPTLQRATSDEVVDLSPTRHYEPEAQPAAFATLKQHGDQLGSSFISQYGVGHQTRDFASTAPAAPVDQPETQAKAPTGAIFNRPHLMRLDSDSTNAPTSVASSVAPTPPAKDTPRRTAPGSSAAAGGEYFNSVAPLRFQSREASPENQQGSLSPQRPTVLPTLSTDTGSDDMDSDRLRHEIVRSLDPVKKDELKRESITEDVERTQDALDAPSNERGMEQGNTPLPAVEATSTRPGLLDTRFSWENRNGVFSSQKAIPEPEPRSPKIKPEMAYERPRDKALHVMNPEDQVDSPAEGSAPVLKEPSAAEHDLTHSAAPVGTNDNLVSPMTRTQELLSPETNLQPTETNPSLQDLAPSPITDDEPHSRNLPSYYAGADDDTSGSEIPHVPEKSHENASSMAPGPDSPSTSRRSAPIPPFRNILAMKTPEERIATYNETRDTFAGMNTGLDDWLSKMLETHPEHANLSTSHTGFKPPALQSPGTNTFKRGHKPSPSLANFKNKFAGGDAQRSTSIGSTDGTSAADSKPTRSTLGDGKGVDMEEVKAKGKEFMKNANVLGGKASQGAKSWFNKSKSRLASGSGSVRGGKNEASSPLVKSSTPAQASPLKSRTQQSSQSMPAASTVPDVPAAVAYSNVVPISTPMRQDAIPKDPTSARAATGHLDQPETRPATGEVQASTTIQLPEIRTPPAPGTSDLSTNETRQHRTTEDETHSNEVSRSQRDASVRAGGRDTPMNDLVAHDESRDDSFVSAEQDHVVSGPVPVDAVGEEQNATHDSRAIQAATRNSLSAQEADAGTSSPAARNIAHEPVNISTAMHDPDAGRTSPLQESAPLALTRTRSPELAPARMAAAEFEGFGNATMSSPAVSATLVSPSIPNTLPAGLTSPTPHSLSRQTSRSSPFRKRDRSQTPSSTRTGASGRPISQAFGRLKDKARSMSRSSTRSARSRPASLALSNPNLVGQRHEDQVAPDGSATATADFALNDLSDVAVRPGMGDHTHMESSYSGVNAPDTEQRAANEEQKRPDPNPQRTRTSRVMSMASPDRTEAWNEPDATIPPKTPTKEQAESPRRLGVLPSPAPTTATFEGDRRASLEVAKRRSSAAPFMGRQSGEFGVELFPVPSADSREEERAGRSGQPDEVVFGSPGNKPASTVDQAAKPQSQVEGTTTSSLAQESTQALYEGTDYPSDKEDDSRPADRHRKYAGLGRVIAAASGSPRPGPHQRKFSDIELLPSQRRNSEFNGGRPDSMALAPLTIPSSESVSAREDVYQVSPVTIASAKPQVASPLQQKSPAAGRVPWSGTGDKYDISGVHRALSTGHEKAIEKMEREIREAAASPAAAEVPVAAMKVKAKDDDARSEISAEGGDPDSYHNTTSPSRHSSVSSLGAQDRGVALEQPAMSAQTVPAGPISGSLTTSQSQPANSDVDAAQQTQPVSTGLTPVKFQQRFANRQYADRRPFLCERPLSYMPGPKDSSGVPQEEISTGIEQQPEIPVDVSALSGPPTGTPPFQQHPVFRNSAVVQPTEYERLRHSRQLSGDVFGGSVPPSKVTDQHMLMGLEDVHEYGTVGSELQRNDQQQQEQKQTRRRSGIWEALSSRRSSRIDKVDSSRESSLTPLPPSYVVQAEQSYQVTEETSKPNTLRKVQRAESSVDPKKKRFSRLGSLFGRSNTSAGDSKKANLLTKNAPPSREDSLRAQTPPTFRQGSGTVVRNVPPANSSSVTGSVRGYEAYEARRRQDLPAFQANAAHMRSVSETAQQQERTFSPGPPPGATGAVQPPPEGRYGLSSAPQPRAPLPPEFRRLHSSGNSPGRGQPLARVPEAFRPVDASFNRSVEPIGPPPGGSRPPTFRNFSSSNVQEQIPVSGQGAYSGPTPSAYMERMMDPNRVRQMSIGSEVSQMSPQTARPFGSDGSIAISPIQTRDTGPVYGVPRENRVGSLGEEMARSPAKEYHDQQTPWSIDMPRARQDGRRMSGAEYNVEQDYDVTGAPQLESGRAPQYHQARALQPQSRLPYTPSGQLGPPRPIPWEDEQPIRQQYIGGDGPYPSSPGAYAPPQTRNPQYAGQQYNPQQQRQLLQSLPPNQQSLPQQNRYYASAQPQQQQQQQQSYHPHAQPRAFGGTRGGRPPSSGRWPSSGYSGRRDDPTVGEEELIMRGASYPGQEWDPRAGGGAY
ncbi:uncharacterized protein CLAFUR5_14606 [Fulvia fulva]|uniref:Uncharacterized protein n=1 Tax=Passalora fulva TaxID=5499 RepID=A0A9Q8PMF2_PASFU|nr:uncharacterized protein CLAFUR5_14606 [Fulvia fulva]UJO25230.1 hypothetical protein CLAFUR5_14606 [Fulvia fulva]